MNLYNDHFENAKRYNIPPAQLIIADIPYNLGNNAYASSPEWYNDGDLNKGESKKANKSFFDTDKDFKIGNFFDFCARLLKKESKEKNSAPCMIIFHAEQQRELILKEAVKKGFKNNIFLVFYKKSSSQVLKANMKIVGNAEYATLLYRDRLPKFRNNGRMILNCQPWLYDTANTPKIHPTQKPIKLLQHLIGLFTDEGDVVIDPCAGSGSTLVAALNLGRKAYGFEIKKEFYKLAHEKMSKLIEPTLFFRPDTHHRATQGELKF